MAYFLFTIQKIWERENGVTIGEGILMSELSAHPNVKNFIQGIPLELRYLNGIKHKTFLLNYGISATRQDNEHLLIEHEPFVRFTLPTDSVDKANIIGAEVWWLSEEAGKSLEEMSELLKAINKY